MEIIIATKNRGKAAEIRNKFSEINGVTVTSLDEYPGAPDIEETGKTFTENALIKARATARFTGKPSLADDSGLVVDALEGRPGVLSARYGGADATDEQRCLKILEEMRGIKTGRGARFVCVMALAFPDGRQFTAEGKIEGIIHSATRGSGGFGYDPVFFIPSLNKTFAELTLEEKNRISHRGLALEKMGIVLSSL